MIMVVIRSFKELQIIAISALRKSELEVGDFIGDGICDQIGDPCMLRMQEIVLAFKRFESMFRLQLRSSFTNRYRSAAKKLQQTQQN